MSDPEPMAVYEAARAARKAGIVEAREKKLKLRREAQRARSGGLLAKALELEAQTSQAEAEEQFANANYREGNRKDEASLCESAVEILGGIRAEVEAVEGRLLGHLTEAYHEAEASMKLRDKLARTSKMLSDAAQRNNLPSILEIAFTLPNGAHAAASMDSYWPLLAAHFELRVREVGADMSLEDFRRRERGRFAPVLPH